MIRRAFLSTVVLTICSSLSLAQQSKVPKIGVLSAGTVASSGHLVEAFVKRLNDPGYIDGQNIYIERLYALGKLERLADLSAKLVDQNVDVIFAPTGSAALAARQVTNKIPIVFALVTDPVGEGFVPSLSRPGGNMTGMSNMAVDLAAKRLEFLEEAGINTSKIGVLYLSTYPGVKLQLDELRRTARDKSKELIAIETPHLGDISAAFQQMKKQGAEAVVVIENPFFFANRNLIMASALEQKLPVIANSREYTVSGALMSYGASYVDLYRRAASHVEKIIKGKRPSDLPVQQSTIFELVVNMETARKLNLETLPVIRRADEIIE